MEGRLRAAATSPQQPSVRNLSVCPPVCIHTSSHEKGTAVSKHTYMLHMTCRHDLQTMSCASKRFARDSTTLCSIRVMSERRVTYCCKKYGLDLGIADPPTLKATFATHAECPPVHSGTPLASVAATEIKIHGTQKLKFDRRRTRGQLGLLAYVVHTTHVVYMHTPDLY